MHEHDAHCAPAPVPHPAAYQPPPQGRFSRWATAAWTKPSWLAPLAVLGCVGLAFSYVLANDPTDAKADPMGPCIFKAVTGYDCPGCGGTRMVWYMLHGNVTEAARHHLVAFLAVPVLAYAFLVWGAQRVFARRLPRVRIPPLAWSLYLGAWGVYAVLRNLPWPPFSYFFVT
jgi:hypothetical protein